jgi:hypothetical protein
MCERERERGGKREGGRNKGGRERSVIINIP